MRDFHRVLFNVLFASVANFFVWFALTFWLYLETKSVLATSLVGGSYLLVTSFSGVWLGAIVDHRKKKHAMMLSSAATAVFFGAALALYAVAPEDAFHSVTTPWLWLMVLLVLGGTTAGNLRSIALPTLATMLVPDAGEREKANGLTGLVMGISSSGAGLSSGFALAYAGMGWVLAIGILCAVLAWLHLAFISVDEPTPVHAEGHGGGMPVDVKGTIAVVRSVTGLFPLLFFSTFNNLLGGVFMALMDPYGLSLISVQAWGALWGVLSTGFIVGGLYIARRGLGRNPLRRLLLANLAIWTVAVVFTLRESIVLFAAGILVWVLVMPSIEASEHSVIQKVVPIDRQGRVFGFAQSLELSASPLTAFLVGPLAQFVLIPFMTTGRGVEWLGGWFGTGAHRGMALAFIGAGIIGLVATGLAMRSRSYRILSERYRAEPAPEASAATST